MTSIFRAKLSKIPCNFIIPFRNILFVMLTAAWLQLVQYFSAEYHNSGQNTIILLCKYIVDLGNAA